MNRRPVILFIFILVVSSCTVFKKPIGTPIPGKPISELTPKPPRGVSGGDSIGDAYIPKLGNTGYDVEHYNLEMAFSSQLDVITSTLTLTSTVTLDNIGRISLDFSNYQVDGVMVNEQYAPYYRSIDKLYIDLPKAYANGDSLVVKVSYHGQVTTVESDYLPGSPLGLRTFTGKNLTYALAEPDGAHAWFPCNDHPLDKATYTFKLTVPKDITAVANGTLLQTLPSSDKATYVWSGPHPMATYLATVIVGKYQRVDAPAVGNVKIRHYVISGDLDFSADLALTQDMLSYYTSLIGPYPFDEFGYIVVLPNYNEGSWAMESQTMVMLTRDIMTNPSAVGVLAHEMVHHWFGDSVSPASWQDIWLDEGFAQYLMLMWLDHQGLINLSEPLDNMEDILVYSGNMENQPVDRPLPANLFGANTYGKAPWILHMLRQEIGDDNFIHLIQSFYQRFAGRNASTADFENVAEQVSGQDLNWFFQQWVYSTGFPRLNVTWTSQPDSVSVQVCQVSSAETFTVPLEVELYLGAEQPQVKTITVDQKQEHVTYSMPASVTDLVVDPEQKQLAYVSIQKVDELTGCEP